MQELSRRRELRTYLAHLRRWLWFLALATIIGAVGAYTVAKLQPTTYLATTLLQVNSIATSQDPYSSVLANNQLVTTYAPLVTQPDVLGQAATQVNGISSPQLANEVHVAALTGTQLLQIQVEDGASPRAAALANAIAVAFIAKHQASVQAEFDQTLQQISNSLTTVNNQIAQLTTQINNLHKNDPTLPTLQQQLTDALAERTSLQNLQAQIATQSLVDGNTIQVFQAALPPASPDHPKPIPYGAAGAALGLILATLVILFQGFLDDRVRNGRDVADVTGLPTIGIVQSPGNTRLLKINDTSQFAQSFRELCTNLNFAAIERPIQTIVVTGANPDEGKTMIAANLAIAFALDGKRVMLIDADLRHGSLDTLLGMQNTSGLSQSLMQNTSAAQQAHAYQSLPRIPNLFVLTAGQKPPHPTELLGDGHLQSFLDSLLGKRHQPGLVDVTILVGPSLLDIADTQVVASVADTAILVVDASQTREDQLLRAFVVLQRVRAKIGGVVLNHARHLHEDVVTAYLSMPATVSMPAIESPPAVSIAGSNRVVAPLAYERKNGTP